MIDLKIEYHAFYKTLKSNPSDWDARLVFADWLEDHEGELIYGIDCIVLSRGQRWQVDNGKHPLIIQHRYVAIWRNNYFPHPKLMNPSFYLDRQMFDMLKGHRKVGNLASEKMFSVELADRELARVLDFIPKCRSIQDQWLRLHNTINSSNPIVRPDVDGLPSYSTVSTLLIQKEILPEYYDWFVEEVKSLKSVLKVR